MTELKFVITGNAGVGKTTAITVLSDIPPMSMEAETTDELAQIKSTTTTAFDFGEIVLDDATRIRLYGTPGQERFRHMWEIIAEGALGLVILIDHTRPDPIHDMKLYLQSFAKLIDHTGVVVGITRAEEAAPSAIERYYEALEGEGIHCPIMVVDPRNKEDMVDIMDVLMSVLEYGVH